MNKIVKLVSVVTSQQTENMLAIASEIWPLFPSRGDGLIKGGLKAMSVVSKIRDMRRGDDHLQRFLRSNEPNGVEEFTNQLFADLFFKTPLRQELLINRFRASLDLTIIAVSSKYGRAYFAEYQGIVGGSISQTFYVSKGFQFEAMLEELWGHYNHKLHVQVTYNPYRGRTDVDYEEIVFNSDPMSKNMLEDLELMSQKQKAYSSKGYARTYLLVGIPGVGKTTLALRFAQRCGDRVLRIDAEGLSNGGTDDMNLFIGGLKPDFVLIEDVDRVTNKSTLSTILETLTNLKERFPRVTIVMTANNLKVMDTAMTRPGRIDKVLQFDPPDEDERRRILAAYFAEYGVEVEIPQEVLDASEGLTAAYLKEVAIQFDCGESLEEILESIEMMQTLINTSDDETPSTSDEPKA